MRNHKKYIIIGILGLIYLFIVIKFNIGFHCIFHDITGLFCPGCGSTRAVVSIVKLDLYNAFRYNMITTSLIFMSIIYFFIKYILKKDLKIPNWMWYVLLIVMIIYTILRNIPYFEFIYIG